MRCHRLAFVSLVSLFGLGCIPAARPSTTHARPYAAVVPEGYSASRPTPLVISLHGFSKDGAQQSGYFKLAPVSRAKTFLYAYPDGTKNRFGLRFWNAGDACCDFDHRGNDDVAYLNAIIDDMISKYNVDPKRIYIVGHSNGAFMAYRMACASASRIAAIVAVSGGTTPDSARCTPSEPVSVLHIHGDHDETIAYGGGKIFGARYPAVAASVAAWAAHDGCTGALGEPTAARDLDRNIAGAETTAQVWSGCPASGGVELWTIHGGRHSPELVDDFGAHIYEFLAAHPKQ